MGILCWNSFRVSRRVSIWAQEFDSIKEFPFLYHNQSITLTLDMASEGEAFNLDPDNIEAVMLRLTRQKSKYETCASCVQALDALKSDACLHLTFAPSYAPADADVEKIANELAKNGTLQVLCMQRAVRTQENLRRIAAALTKNHALRVLDLSHNNIGDDGAKFLATALQVNLGLESLYLSTNQISCEGAEALLEVLETAKLLTKLRLDGNPIATSVGEKDEQVRKRLQTAIELQTHMVLTIVCMGFEFGTYRLACANLTCEEVAAVSMSAPDEWLGVKTEIANQVGVLRSNLKLLLQDGSEIEDTTAFETLVQCGSR